MFLAFAALGLIFGLGWYFLRLDQSPLWIKLVWFVLALFASPYAEIALVYRRQVCRARQRTRSAGAERL